MLSDNDILQEIINENIIICPFDINSLGLASYDVKLGNHFWRENKVSGKIADIWSYKGIRELWTKGETITWGSLEIDNNRYSPDTPVILLNPGDCILAHTEEFIGGVKGINTKMHCRSSYGRCNISVCLCAGFGDPGFFNRWTMEIRNMSSLNSIPLVVGQKIAQISFYKLVSTESSTYSEKGHYQAKNMNLHELMNKWSPDDMLPKL